jgi:tRNA 2-thiouridine synthesizing protein A
MAQDHSNDSRQATHDGELIDARGLNCPLPVLKLRKRLRAGARTIDLLATDRAALRDVPAFCATHGHEVEVSAEPQGVWRFRIMVRSQA